MLQGKPYLASDETLTQERQEARQLMHQVNQLDPTEIAERNRLLAQLLGHTGNNFHIEQPFRCDYGYNIEIGENFYANYNCTILDCAKVSIGNNVLFAPNVSLFTAGHPIDAGKRNEGWEHAFPIVIGNDVWIGGNVTINPGITVGSNVVIGSGSVVTRDIPDNVIAAGNPCRVIRAITDEDKLYYFKNLNSMNNNH